MRFLLVGFLLLASTSLGATVTDFELSDQNATPRVYHFPKTKVTVMTVADHKGSDQLTPWIQSFYDRYGTRIDIDGIADVSMIPKPFQRMFREAFRKKLTRSVMLDWNGAAVKQFGYKKGIANIYVIDQRGNILSQASGPISKPSFDKMAAETDRVVPH